MKEVIREFRNILGSIMVLATPLSTSALAGILNPEANYRSATRHAAVRSGHPNGFKVAREILHVSFRDFLLDPDKQG